MLSYILKRILSLIPVLFVVSCVIFLVVYMIPGGPATALLGMEATPDQIETLNAELGFDRPFLVQYADWFTGVLRGDWGTSYFLHQSVTEAIAEYFPPTMSLAILAQIIALILAVPLGILAAYRRGTALDVTCVTASLLGAALPGFLLSMFLMLFFGVYLHWFPVAGYASLAEGLGEHLRYLFLPALSLGIVQAAYITRMTRSSLLEVLYKNYIQTARGKRTERTESSDEVCPKKWGSSDTDRHRPVFWKPDHRHYCDGDSVQYSGTWHADADFDHPQRCICHPGSRPVCNLAVCPGQSGGGHTLWICRPQAPAGSEIGGETNVAITEKYIRSQ